MTAFLAGRGLSMFGLDLSESMLAIARRENPGLRFERGSMLELNLPDRSLDGVVSWYSTIHTPWTTCRASSPSSTASCGPAGICCSASRSATSPAATRRPSGTRWHWTSGGAGRSR